MIRPAALLCLALALAAADNAWPELPDPIGLGPRLATIDWLKDHGIAVAPGAKDAEVLALYRKATFDPVAAAKQDELARLRYLLRANHGIDAPADADLARLKAMLADAERAAREAELANTAAVAAAAEAREAAALAAQREAAAAAPKPDGKAGDATGPSADNLPVPLAHQIPLRDLTWQLKDRSTGNPYWKRADGSSEAPNDAGAINAWRLSWLGKDYRISGYVSLAPPPQDKFKITTDVGSFLAIRLNDKAWHVEFTDNAGVVLVFRTSSKELENTSRTSRTTPWWSKNGAETAPAETSPTETKP